MAQHALVVILLLVLVAFLIDIGMCQVGFPKGFRPASAIPDEFFTCKKREPGLYADDKRSCNLYWNCSSEGAEPDHIQCPPKMVFDDRLKMCVESESGKCPIDYGYFETAQSFCRGRPFPSNSKSHLEPSAQQYYAVIRKNCDSYFWCIKMAGETFGVEFQCPKGEKFDDQASLCKKAEEVTCAESHGAELV